MFLYLLRHADAETIAPTDDERFLSEKGIAQAKKAARFCATHGLVPELIVMSPIRRARETAEIVATHLNLQPQIGNWLASGMVPATALRELGRYTEMKSVMIVGHEPDFSELAAELLGAELSVRKSSLTGIEVGMLARHGARLDFLVPARFM